MKKIQNKNVLLHNGVVHKYVKKHADEKMFYKSMEIAVPVHFFSTFKIAIDLKNILIIFRGV